MGARKHHRCESKVTFVSLEKSGVPFPVNGPINEKVESLRDAVSRQRQSLASKGTLDLSGKVRFPASDLLSLSTLPTLTTLILTGCPLKSLESLPPQPCLKTVSADRSYVEVFRGLNSHPSLASISFVGAPIADAVNYRIAALLLIPRLSVVNGVVVSASERALRDRYPPVARQLVSAGWIVQAPPHRSRTFAIWPPSLVCPRRPTSLFYRRNRRRRPLVAARLRPPLSMGASDCGDSDAGGVSDPEWSGYAFGYFESGRSNVRWSPGNPKIVVKTLRAIGISAAIRPCTHKTLGIDWVHESPPTIDAWFSEPTEMKWLNASGAVVQMCDLANIR
jgi:hypothetical protein